MTLLRRAVQQNTLHCKVKKVMRSEKPLLEAKKAVKLLRDMSGDFEQSLFFSMASPTGFEPVLSP